MADETKPERKILGNPRMAELFVRVMDLKRSGRPLTDAERQELEAIDTEVAGIQAACPHTNTVMHRTHGVILCTDCGWVKKPSPPSAGSMGNQGE